MQHTCESIGQLAHEPTGKNLQGSIHEKTKSLLLIFVRLDL